MTLEDFLKEESQASRTPNFHLRMYTLSDGTQAFSLHPLGKSGRIEDFIVKENITKRILTYRSTR